jgi:hypothetical protein
MSVDVRLRNFQKKKKKKKKNEKKKKTKQKQNKSQQMSDDQQLTPEQLEERRLLRSMAGANKAKSPFAAKPAVVVEALPTPAAPAAATSATSPRAAGGVAPWKQRQLDAEAETRARLEAESVAKQAQLKVSVHGVDTAATMLSPRADAESVQQERILVDYLHGKTGATDAVQHAADAERERLESIFKAKPTTNKKRFEPIAKEAQERLVLAQKEREEAEAKADAEADALEARRNQLVSERAIAATQTIRAAERHYDGPDNKTEFLNDLERGLVAELTALRADPDSFRKKLIARRMQYDGLVVKLHDPNGPTVSLKTADGVAAVDAAIKALEGVKSSPLKHEKDLTRAMFTAVRKAAGAKPNAVADVASYGKVSGSARQIMYRGPIIDALDIVLALLVDDGEPQRTRRDAILADKFKHFGVAAACDETGKFNYCHIILISNFEGK